MGQSMDYLTGGFTLCAKITLWTGDMVGVYLACCIQFSVPTKEGPSCLWFAPGVFESKNLHFKLLTLGLERVLLVFHV